MSIGHRQYCNIEATHRDAALRAVPALGALRVALPAVVFRRALLDVGVVPGLEVSISSHKWESYDGIERA